MRSDKSATSVINDTKYNSIVHYLLLATRGNLRLSRFLFNSVPLAFVPHIHYPKCSIVPSTLGKRINEKNEFIVRCNNIMITYANSHHTYTSLHLSEIIANCKLKVHYLFVVLILYYILFVPFSVSLRNMHAYRHVLNIFEL